MIIDAHTHGLNGKYLKPIAEIGGNWTKKVLDDLQQRAGDRPQYFDMTFRVELLDNYGFDYQIVTPTPFYVSLYPGDAATRLEITRRINDNMATIREESKGRLVPVGTIPLEGFNDATLKEMRRAIKSLGLKGLSVPSNIVGKPLDTPEFEPFWAEAVALDIPVYIHPKNPAKMIDRSYEADYDLAHQFGWPFETTLALARLVFSGIMERYPKLKIINHHLGGGMIPFFWGRTLETYEPSKQPRLLGKTMPKLLFDYFSKFYYDTAVGGSAAAIRCAYEVFGANQLVFATDSPMGPEGGQMRLRTYPDVVRSVGLPKDETEKILSGNILKVFKSLTD